MTLYHAGLSHVRLSHCLRLNCMSTLPSYSIHDEHETSLTMAANPFVLILCYCAIRLAVENSVATDGVLEQSKEAALASCSRLHVLAFRCSPSETTTSRKSHRLYANRQRYPPY